MRKTILIPLALLASLATASPRPSLAAETPRGGTLSITWENDMFYSIDRHYTKGGHISWVPGEAVPPPGWLLKTALLLPWFHREGEIRHGYALGHSMFTPSDIRNPDPDPGDRPYAGWLYVTAGLGIKADRRLDLFWLTAGIVGPASLAEQPRDSSTGSPARTSPVAGTRSRATNRGSSSAGGAAGGNSPGRPSWERA